MMMRKLLASVALLTTAGLAAGGTADGMNASTPCQACHGADGIGISDDIPNLAGQKAAYLQAQLKAFMCLACHKGVAADSFLFTLGQLKSYGR